MALGDLDSESAQVYLKKYDNNVPLALRNVEKDKNDKYTRSKTMLTIMMSTVLIYITILEIINNHNLKPVTTTTFGTTEDEPQTLPYVIVNVMGIDDTVDVAHIKYDLDSSCDVVPNNCRASEFDQLVCANGDRSIIGQNSPEFDWRFCTNVGSKRELCPKESPVMCASPTSGAGGTDYACWYNIFDCQQRINGGSRTCPDGSNPDWTYSTCQNRTVVVDRHTPFHTEPGKIYKIFSGTTYYVITPAENWNYTKPEQIYEIVVRNRLPDNEGEWGMEAWTRKPNDYEQRIKDTLDKETLTWNDWVFFHDLTDRNREKHVLNQGSLLSADITVGQWKRANEDPVSTWTFQSNVAHATSTDTIISIRHSLQTKIY
eukprot:UN24980